jgi:septation ring formation regulator EzrA
MFDENIALINEITYIKIYLYPAHEYKYINNANSMIKDMFDENIIDLYKIFINNIYAINEITQDNIELKNELEKFNLILKTIKEDYYNVIKLYKSGDANLLFDKFFNFTPYLTSTYDELDEYDKHSHSQKFSTYTNITKIMNRDDMPLSEIIHNMTNITETIREVINIHT